MYQILLSQQKDILSKSNSGHVQEIYYTGENQICIRQSRSLNGYNYQESTNTWAQQWNHTIFKIPGDDYTLKRYPWLITDRLIPNTKVVILKHPDGIQLFQLDEHGLKLLKEDGNFHDVYSNKYLLGYFYENPNWIGVMTTNSRGEINFYGITEDSFDPNNDYSLLPLNIDNNSLSTAWHSIKTEFYTTKFQNQDAIVLKTDAGLLEFYCFNSEYILKNILKTSQIKSADRLFFVNLTNREYQDIVTLTHDGLEVYQYDKTRKDFIFINRNIDFTPEKHWQPLYTATIHFIDLNNDKQDDLVFTGAEGLTAMTFNPRNRKWDILIAPEVLSGSQRYGNIIEILNTNVSQPSSSMFIQNTDGTLQWARIIPTPNQPIGIESIEEEPITVSTTFQQFSKLIVQARQLLPQKPILRLAESLEYEFMKEAVDMANGKIAFSIPLVDVSESNGVSLKLKLDYNSQDISQSDLIGVGWSLPLGKDYIFVDYQGSIYFQDAHFYLMLQGQTIRLLLTKSTQGGNILHFESSQSDEEITIEYNQSKQTWTLNSQTYQQVYGKSDQTLANDCLQWTLNWPNWYGLGTQKTGLKPSITSWYLNTHFDKHREQSLFYDYEIDNIIFGDQSYTSAIRLKTIRIRNGFKITFDYQPKHSDEYTISKAINDDGMIDFPIRLTQSHYLSGYEISTNSYQQSIRFQYQMNPTGKRILTAIKQDIYPEEEAVFEFNYQLVLNKPVLTSCKTSRGSIVNFKYETLNLPSMKANRENILSYPIQSENIKINYGGNYTVLGYDNFNYIHLQILNRELTERVLTLSSCPFVKGDTFSVQTFENVFIIIVSNKQSKKIFVFIRHDEEWSTEPILYKYDTNALILFSETLIIVGDLNNREVNLFDLKDVNLWQDPIKFNLSFTSLALHKRSLVVYDDNQLWLVHYTNHWEIKVLLYLPGITTMTRQTIYKFDLDTKIQTEFITDLIQNYLQITNNLIILKALNVNNNDQLSSKVYLILLDSQYHVTKTDSFHFDRELIYNMQHKIEHEHSVFHLTYKKINGKFKLQVTSISGQVVQEIEKKVRNRNLREDQIENYIEQLNDSDNFQTIFKEHCLINWELYAMHITGENAIQIGSDTKLIMTGTHWESTKISKDLKIYLGKQFHIDSVDDTKMSFELYKNQNVIKQFKIYLPGQMINRFPIYFAYQSTSRTINVLTFKDENTFDKEHVFHNEQLIFESDYQNLITKSNITLNSLTRAEPFECLIRPIVTLISPNQQYFVNEASLSYNNFQRRITYQQSFNYNPIKSTYSQTVTMIPTGDKTISGWYEIIYSRNIQTGKQTQIQHWFDSNGKMIEMPVESGEQHNDSSGQTNVTPKYESFLMDRSNQWFISDFTPYVSSDQMISYYGFETYESYQQPWQFNRDNVIQGLGAFTGDNYLKIVHGFVLQGVFKPRDQDNSYIVSCWVRSDNSLIDAVSNLKMILRTVEGQEIFTNFGQVKNQITDWYYLELIIDFQVIKGIYKDYLTYYKNISGSLLDVKFEIIIRVEAEPHQIIDLDHIRFSPLTHDFEAYVYKSEIGVPIATIHENGLVTRTVYNCLHKKIATIQVDGKLEQFTSVSRIGRLIPTPIGVKFTNQHPTHLIFKPETSSYENFRFGWKTDSPNVWHLSSPGQLSHNEQTSHRIQADDILFDKKSFAIRFYYMLHKSKSSLSIILENIGEIKFTCDQNQTVIITLPNNHKISQLPQTGEIIIMVEVNFVWIWFDGVLLVDQVFQEHQIQNILTIEAQGEIFIEDFLIMNRPHLEIRYKNPFNEEVQIIKFEDSNTALVNQIIYDVIGRKAITTKSTRIKRSNDNSPLLIYRSAFVTNINPDHPKSVWNTNRLYGEVDYLNPNDMGVPFIRTEYWANTLNEEKILGLPGPEFSTTGHCATWISNKSKIAFMDNLFPRKYGYQQKVQISSNGAEKISVYDKYNNKIAFYVHVPGFNHLLSTYEYDNDNRLIKILSPVYHEKVNTALKLTPWEPNILSSGEKEWQRLLATQLVYNENGQVIRKINPDSGVTEYLYNTMGQMRFMISFGSNNQTNQIVYFEYNEFNQLISTGYFNKSISIENLKQNLINSVYLPDTEKFQQFDYSDYHPNPKLRGLIKHCITHNDDGETILEMLKYNTDEQIIERKTLTVIDEIENKVKISYENDKINMFSYQSLNLAYKYNRLDQLVELKLMNNSKIFYANFTYHPTGELASEYFQSANSFTRKYSYNSPGFLEQISDPFMTEKLFYTEKGYGQAGYGDGIIMQTKFNVSWPNNSDQRWFQLTEDILSTSTNHSKICLHALKQSGYLNDQNQSIKLYAIDAETTIPLVCTGKTGKLLAKFIVEKQIPRNFGYRFAYGNHQELVKAKYFTTDTEALIDPLQINTFSKLIPELNTNDSEKIWQILTKAGYILKDQQRHNPSTAIGKRGKTVFRDLDLKSDLSNLNSDYILYVEPIKKLIIKYHFKTIPLNEFVKIFLKWQGFDRDTSSLLEYNWYEKIAKQIGMMLINKEYFSIKSLDNNFIQILNNYKKFIPNIVQILSHHFAYALGETTFDHESYEIDANGNHHHFYAGFDQYKLTYRNGTNKVENLQVNSETKYQFKHDSNGNVIQALHKGIESIVYHPVTQRATRIQMSNGRNLRFYYDAQGERILKKVFTANGKLSHETRYVRDENGRVLIDHQKKYLKSTIEILTYYLYGPRGLIGIIRNDTFYNVLTDHAGSIRLIVRATGNEVIASFDYKPYGNLMRTFGNQIDFIHRYTGQEWDEETDLYNYHARLYDPTIGRFYQPDPKAQYFSPYMYAGNSPISTIDPDGEFAFLITFMIIGAIAGAYLGGAAANNRWNPAVWDWKDPGTYFGIVFGGISGAFLPVNIGSSIALFGGGILGASITATLALTGSYIMMSAANGNVNPLKWKWSSPRTLNAFFDGLGLFPGLFGGIGQMHKFANTLKWTNPQSLNRLYNSLKLFGGIGKMQKFANKIIAWILINGGRLTKAKFLFLSYSSAVSVAYAHGVMANEGKIAFWDWDWKNPNTYAALITGFDIGVGLPQGFKEMHFGFKKHKARSALKISTSKRQLLKAILKNPKHPLYKVAGATVMGYLVGSSANGDFDFTQWRFNTFATYEGILNGIFLSKGGSKMLTMAKQSITKGLRKFTLRNIIRHAFRKNIKILLRTMAKNQKRSLYRRLMEHSFKEFDTKLIGHLPQSTKQQIIEFFQSGYTKWKTGKSKVPKDLEQMLLKQVDKRIESTSKKLIKWQNEAEKIHKNQHEIYTDRDIEFLNCKSGRRRKRGTNNRIICTSSSAIDDEGFSKLFNRILEIKDSDLPTPANLDLTINNGFKLIQPKSLNYPDGFDPHSPKDFAEHFSLMLEHTPYMFEINKPYFTSNIIAGSIYSSTSSLRGNIDDIYIKTEISKGHSLVKVAFKTTINDETSLILKTFVVEPKPKTKYHKSKFQEFNNIYDVDELKAISEKLDITGDKYPIHEHVFFLKSGNLLYGKDVSTTRDQYSFNDKFKGNSNIEFNKIEPELNKDFETQLSKIKQTDDVTEMEVAVKEITKDLLKMYDKYASLFKLPKTKNNPKPGLTSFLYGAFSSHLKNAFVQRIAGKGYANLIFHVPKHNLNDIPVVMDRSQSTTVAFGKSMFYSLSLKSLAKKGLFVSINTVKSTVETYEVDVPESKGFIREILKDTVPKAKDIENELKYHYYNISKMALKQDKSINNHYHRCLIIGQLMADSTIHAYFHATFGSKLSTFAFKDTKYQKWTQLNVMESSKVSRSNYVFNNDGFNPPSTLPATSKSNIKVNQIDIKLNSRASGWSVEEKLRVTDPEDPKRMPGEPYDKHYYNQGVEVNEHDITKFTDAFDDYKRIESVNIEELFKNTNTGYNPSMISLKDNLQRLSIFINSESDFQAVLHGLFLSNKRDPTKGKPGYMYRVYAESNPAKSGRIDLLIQKFETTTIVNQFTEKELIVMELKYTRGGNIDRILEDADLQGNKYESNLASFTDLDSFTLIPMVFDKESGTIKYKIKTDQMIRNVDINDINPIQEVDPNKRVRSDPEDTIDTEASNSGSDAKHVDIDQTGTIIPNPNLKRPRKGRSLDNNEDTFINSTVLLKAISSKGNRLQFWPTNLVKRAGTAVLSLLSTSWTNTDHKSGNPTLLEMGDNLVKNTDTNGLLTWGILLANKWTGYRPKPIPQNEFDNMTDTELKIRSEKIVDYFMEQIDEFEFKSRDIFENSVLYFDAIKKVHQKLSTGEINIIPRMLFKLIVEQNVEKTMAYKFWTKMSTNSIAEFMEYINQQEYEWLSHRQCSIRSPEFYNNAKQSQQPIQKCSASIDVPKISYQNYATIH